MNNKKIIRDKKLKKYNIALMLSMIIFILIVAYGIFGDIGFIALIRVEKEKEFLKKEIDKIEQENQILRNKINNLQNDKFAIEKEVREKLVYSKEGEVIILLPDENINNEKNK